MCYSKFSSLISLHILKVMLCLLQLLLMKRGGRVIYAGPLGRESHKLIEYFEVSLPFFPFCGWFSYH